MPAADLPSPAALAAFLRGDPAAEPTAAHLDTCPDCLARIGQLQDDDALVAGLRSADALTRSGGPPPPVAAPPAVPGYTLGAELGRGGMAVVYAADSHALKRTVAVKLLRDGHRAAPDQWVRFRAEAVALARLQHPNVVQVFDSGTAGGVPFLVLEYVPGGTLAEKGRVPPREAARLAAAVAAGVQAAHEAGVVHRDLKPANVLVAADGTPKVSDFGLAKLSEAATVTVSGTVAGTPAYMAPEQADGSALPGPLMDVYALGGVLYHLLSGRPPFDGDSVLAVLRQVREADPPPLPAAPPDLDTICRKCLRKEPGKRYPSAAAVADDLRRWLAGEPIAARPVGPAERAWLWGRRHPAIAGLAACLAVAVLAGVLGVAGQFRRAEAERVTARNTAAAQALDQGILLCEAGKLADGVARLDQAAELSAGTDRRLDACIAANRRTWLAPARPARRTPIHGTPATAAVLSRDGRELLVAEWGNNWGATKPGRAVVYPADDLAAPRLAVEHPGTTVRTAAWHPAGAAFVTGGMDGTVRLWDAATGAPLGEPLRHVGPVGCLGFSPDGTRLAVAASSVWPIPDGTTVTAEVRVWDWATRTLARPAVPTAVVGRSLAWSPDGKTVAVAGLAGPGWAHGAGLLLDPTTGAVREGFAQPDPLRSVAWHPAGWLATAGDDGVVRFWEADGRRRPGLLTHPLRVNALRFAADGAVLAAGCGYARPDNPLDGPGEVQCWETAGWERLGPPLRENRAAVCNRVNDLGLSPDGTRLAAAGENGFAWVADLVLPARPLAVARLPAPPTAAVFAPDGSAVAVPAGDQVHLLAGHTLAPRAVLPAAASTVRFHPAGHTLLTHREGVVRVWDAATGSERPADLGPAAWADWSADGAELWACDPAGDLRRRDAGTLAAVGDPLPVGAATSLPGATQPVVLGVRPGRATLWFPRAGRRVDLGLTFAGAPRVDAGLYCGGSVVVAAIQTDWGRSEVWAADAATGRVLAGPVRVDREVMPLGGADDRVLVWAARRADAAEYHLADPRTLSPLTAPATFDTFGDIHPGLDLLATASGPLDPRPRLASFAGRAVGPPVPHPERVPVVRFSPAGDRLLTGGADRTVRLWPVP